MFRRTGGLARSHCWFRGLYPSTWHVRTSKDVLVPASSRPRSGEALLEHALARAKEIGFRRMVLETASVLKEAIALYRAIRVSALSTRSSIPAVRRCVRPRSLLKMPAICRLCFLNLSVVEFEIRQTTNGYRQQKGKFTLRLRNGGAERRLRSPKDRKESDSKGEDKKRNDLTRNPLSIENELSVILMQ